MAFSGTTEVSKEAGDAGGATTIAVAMNSFIQRCRSTKHIEVVGGGVAGGGPITHMADHHRFRLLLTAYLDQPRLPHGARPLLVCPPTEEATSSPPRTPVPCSREPTRDGSRRARLCCSRPARSVRPRLRRVIVGCVVGSNASRGVLERGRGRP